MLTCIIAIKRPIFKFLFAVDGMLNKGSSAALASRIACLAMLCDSPSEVEAVDLVNQ